MSVQQSINQSILAAGALYSQSGAAEQRKGKLELKREEKSKEAADEKYDELKHSRYSKASDELLDALYEYRMKKSENIMNLGFKYGNFKAYEKGRRDFKFYQEFLNDPKRHEEFQYDPNYVDDDDDDYDEYEQAAQKEKDRREKRVMMRQANRAAVKKRMEMLDSRDFRQDMFGGN